MTESEFETYEKEPEEGFRVYRRRTTSDVWHFAVNCSNWPTPKPDVSPPGADVRESRSHKPTYGEFCNECLAKRKNGRARFATTDTVPALP